MNLFKKLSIGFILMFLFLFATNHLVSIAKADNVTVTSTPLVDLTADAPTQTLASTLTPIEFTTNIHNSGTVATGVGFDDSWNISTTADISNKITTLTTNYPISLPAGGQTYVVPGTTSPAYTFASAGTYYVQACADSGNVIAETNENNNCSTWTAISVSASPLADLTADKPTQTLATTLTPIEFDTNIHNLGTISTGEGFYNSWDISTTADISNKITTLTTYYPIPLAAAGQTYVVPSTTSPAYTFSVPGTYYVRACADSTNIVAETNENNNCSGWVGIVATPVNTCANGATDYPTCTPPVNTCTNGATDYPTCTPPVNTCANGATDYPTCTPPPSTTSGTISATDCTIASGSSTCSTTLNWSTVNPVGTSAVTTPTKITVANGNSGSNKTYSMSFGSRNFYLYNSAVFLGQATATAACASGTSWNGTQCSTSTTLCTVATDTNYNTGPCSGTCLNGSNDYPICKITTVTTSGNLSVTDCKIASGASSCDTTITWSIVNPIPSKTTAITTPNSITVPGTSSTSGTATYPVSTGPGTRDFYLYHNGVQLGSTRTAHSSCIQGTDWDTTSGTCKDLPPGSGGWSDWSSIPDVCPLASGVQTRNCNYPAPSNGGLECLTESGTRALVETKAYPAVTSDQCPSIKDVVITPSNGGAAIDTTDSGSTIVTAKQVPYNAKLNIDWTSSNIQINECTCVYKDSTHKSGKDCPNFDGTSSYALPSLKKDTTFTISCAGSFSGNVSQDIKIKVAPINATYIEN